MATSTNIITAGIVSSLSTLSASLVNLLIGIAPLAIAVFAVLFAWRLGKRFFSSIAK